MACQVGGTAWPSTKGQVRQLSAFFLVLESMGAELRCKFFRFVVGIFAVVVAPAFSRESVQHKTTNSFKIRLSKPEIFLHALNRLTFGPRPGDLEAITQMGLKRWMDLQLHPDRITENPLLLRRLQPLESLQLSIREAYLRYPPPQLIGAIARGRGELPDDPELRTLATRLAERYLQKKHLDPPATLSGTSARMPQNPNDLSDLEGRLHLSDILNRRSDRNITTWQTGREESNSSRRYQLGKQSDFVWALPPQERQRLLAFAPVPLRRELMRSVAPQNVIAMDLTEGKMLRAVYSNRQLQELMVDFWFNHFNVFLNKGADRYTVPAYERDAIRPHVFGTFHDLLLETAKSPAMLFYLDNWQSVAPEKAQATTRPNARPRRGLNENYGRELLELHTLGVDGGYTQHDVTEVARCFTGWTIAAPRKGGGFEYNDRLHDKGRKVVLGYVIPAGGGMS